MGNIVRDINVPETARIYGNYYPGRNKIIKQEFWKLAKRKTIYMNTPDYVAYRYKILDGKFAEYRYETATFTICRDYDTNGDYCIWGLEIAINEGSFISGTKDLIKYILEHEIYEAWLMLNSKDNNEDFDICHLLARKHEYRLAVADGNGLRLLKYHKLCVSNSDNCMQQTEEFQYAYDLALKRRPTSQLEKVYIE